MSQELRDQVALVTGASRGLGAAIAVRLAAGGAKVAVNYFGSPDLAQNVVARICNAGGVADAFRADVRDEQAVAGLVDQVQAKFGLIDVLVINATGPQPFIR